jgi:tripartite-type tricarboxylate transporter receptor subunit TctC
MLRPANRSRLAAGIPLALLAWLAIAALAQSVPAQQSASDYPNRMIVVICPWAPGGGTDRVARFLADQLQRELGKPVVVQNQTGGSGATGHTAGAQAKPDGYTLTLGTFELSTMRAMGVANLSYRDFQPLLQVNADPAAIIVRSDAPWQSLTELLADVRAKPGTLKMSGTAAGGAWDLARAGLLLAADLPTDAVVWIPSQGSAPSLVELLGGHVDAVCCSIPEAQSQLEAGQLRILSVLARERVAEYPDAPTAIDEGIDWEAVGWRGLFLPPETPDEVRDLLTEKLVQITGSAAYREFMAQNGFGITIRTGDDFREFLEAQEARWTPVVEAAGYSAQDGQSQAVSSADPGPWFFPRLLAIGLLAGLVVLGGAEFMRTRRTAGQDSAPSALPVDENILHAAESAAGSQLFSREACLLVAGIILYVGAIPWLGFFPSTLLFATLLMIRQRLPWWQAILLSAAMLAIVYLLFVQQFRVVLPAGAWWAS